MSKNYTKKVEPSKKGKSGLGIKEKENEKSEGKVKDIYFLLLYPRKQREKPDEFVFSEDNINPQIIYVDEQKNDNGIYFYKKVFKFKGKTKQNYGFEFEIGKDSYSTYFEVKENSFVYDVGVRMANKIPQNIAKKNIDKNIGCHKKLDIFLEALKKHNEEDKIETLYKDTIDSFEKKKGFSFLISLFVQIYKNKELCPLLLDKFKEMNKEPNYYENMDRNRDLEQYIQIFRNISSDADNLINRNSYDFIQFYGILLCYSHNYDYDNFITILQKLFAEKCEALYEILLIYCSHFFNPIIQQFDFFTQFIGYCASKKEFKDIKIVLNYIRDIETFIAVINETKDKIVESYAKDSFEPIKLGCDLDLIKKEKNEEIDNIIKAIESIISYSKEKNVLLVYFTSTFWKRILEGYASAAFLSKTNTFSIRHFKAEIL